MKYHILINQSKVLEWGLNTSEAILVDLFSHLPSWAEKYQIINNEIWYFFSKKKILEEVPMLGNKIDTIYRICKKLQEKGLLEFQKIRGKDFWKMSEKLKEWNFKNISESSEKNPSSETILEETSILKEKGKLGKISDTRKKIRENSENFPTYNNTIDYNINISSNEEILCDEENSDFSLKNFSEKNSENITQTGHEEVSQSSADSTKLKLGQSSEAEKLVRKTSAASKTTELNEKKAKMLAFLKNTIGCDKFKDYSEWQEAGRFLNLAEKLGKEQFLYRLEKILEDPFKARNSNKLAYLRKEIEAFIHSPIIPKTEKFSVGQA